MAVVICRFEPKAPTMGGSGGGRYHFARGGWRVFDVIDARIPAKSVRVIDGFLWVPSVQPRRRGTRINPHKVLTEFLEWRRGAVTAVAAVAHA